MSPQLKYIRECRADPVFRRYELDRQRERRDNDQSRERRREYHRRWRAAKKLRKP